MGRVQKPLIRRFRIFLKDFFVSAAGEFFLGDQTHCRVVIIQKRIQKTVYVRQCFKCFFALKTRISDCFSHRIIVFLFNKAIIIFLYGRPLMNCTPCFMHHSRSWLLINSLPLSLSMPSIGNGRPSLICSISNTYLLSDYIILYYFINIQFYPEIWHITFKVGKNAVQAFLR